MEREPIVVTYIRCVLTMFAGAGLGLLWVATAPVVGFPLMMLGGAVACLSAVVLMLSGGRGQ